MIRSLAVTAIVLGSMAVWAADVSAQGLYSSSRYLSVRSGSFIPSPRSARVLDRYIDYSTRSYNNQRSYSTGYSRSSSYGLYNTPYYYSPYQSRGSYGYRDGNGYGYGYGREFGFERSPSDSYHYDAGY